MYYFVLFFQINNFIFYDFFSNHKRINAFGTMVRRLANHRLMARQTDDTATTPTETEPIKFTHSSKPFLQQKVEIVQKLDSFFS